MKQAVLLHGTGGGSKDYFWFANTKTFLESNGYKVWWPQLPNTDKPNFEESRNFLEDNFPFGDLEQTVVIGHSSACPLLLDFLQYLEEPIRQLILVAGFYESIDDEGFSELMLPKDGFNFKKVRANAQNIILINSDNDPWGCDDKQARPVAEKLGAKFILAEGQGHMGSISFDQPYRNFPELLEEILTK